MRRLCGARSSTKEVMDFCSKVNAQLVHCSTGARRAFSHVNGPCTAARRTCLPMVLVVTINQRSHPHRVRAIFYKEKHRRTK